MDKSESFIVGTFLAIAGGFLDSYTYVCRGGIFANAQTGNLIFLGLSLTEGNLALALFYLIPVLAFSAGVFISEWVKLKCSGHSSLHWTQRSLTIEILVLILISFLPSGELDVIANISIAFVCGIQVQSFRKLYGNAYATTMCTGNLRSGTECFFYGLMQKDATMRKSSCQYFGIIFIFILGVIIGAVCTHWLQEYAALLVALVLAFPLWYLKKPKVP